MESHERIMQEMKIIKEKIKYIDCELRNPKHMFSEGEDSVEKKELKEKFKKYTNELSEKGLELIRLNIIPPMAD